MLKHQTDVKQIIELRHICFQYFEHIFPCLNICFDQYYQNWWSMVQNTEKMKYYSMVKTNFCLEQYLIKGMNANIFSQLRSGSMKLNVEIGRYANIPREERVCRCCLMNVIEDEVHFTLVCPTYRQFRFKYLPSQYCSWLNINKFVTLLRT